MKLLVTGGTGCIGYQLLPTLVEAGHTLWVLTRRSADKFDTCNGNITYIRNFDDAPEVDGVINLAGEGILDRRWSEKRKQELLDSRIDLTARLLSWMEQCRVKPKVLISGSAVGYYGFHEQNVLLDESCPSAQDFAATLCQRWESEALKAKEFGVRVCILRIGVVLAGESGALAKMLLPFRLGLGGPVANGEQMFSWIQREDLVAMMMFLLHSPDQEGVFNATSPIPVTNKAYSEEIAKAVGRPCWLTVPAYALRLLLGEGADLLVKGQAVMPTRFSQLGFEFRYPEIEGAIRHSLEN